MCAPPKRTLAPSCLQCRIPSPCLLVFLFTRQSHDSNRARRAAATCHICFEHVSGFVIHLHSPSSIRCFLPALGPAHSEIVSLLSSHSQGAPIGPVQVMLVREMGLHPIDCSSLGLFAVREGMCCRRSPVEMRRSPPPPSHACLLSLRHSHRHLFSCSTHRLLSSAQSQYARSARVVPCPVKAVRHEIDSPSVRPLIVTAPITDRVRVEHRFNQSMSVLKRMGGVHTILSSMATRRVHQTETARSSLLSLPSSLSCAIG
jgi:hypothetical protein